MAYYDISKLETIDELNAKIAVGNFSNAQKYFDVLDVFLEGSKECLIDLNPTVIVHSPDVRRNFLASMEGLTKSLADMEQHALVKLSNDLVGCLETGNTETFAIDLLLFSSKIDILAAAIAAAQTDQPPATQPGEKPLVLAVDDKPELLTSIVCMLQDDYTVVAVTSGKAALKAIGKRKPDLFLLDIEMPVMDGYELAKNIRINSQFTQTPIIFLTAKGTREHVTNAIQKGVNDYIIKPVEKDLLLSKIKRHLKL